MGEIFPKYPTEVSDGDEPSYSPTKTHKSVLGVERGTQYTRRLEMDADGNAYVNVAADARKDTLLFSASLSSIAASTPTAFTAYTAPSAVKIYKVLITGSAYTDFTLRHLGSSIGKKLTNLEMQVEFSFDQGYELATSDSMDAIVDHCVTGKTKDFNIYIYGE